MMRYIYDKLTMQSHTIANDTPTYSNSQNGIMEHITKIQNQPIEFINLPAELKQKIAFKLDGISYCNLHLTAKKIHDDLPSFKTMLHQLKDKCSGEIRKNYIEMYEKSIKQLIENEKKDDVIQCIKYISADRRYLSSDSVTLYTKYVPAGNKIVYPNQWSGFILYRCHDEIKKLSNTQEMSSVILNEFTEPFSRNSYWFVNLDLKDKDINKQNLNVIFKAFNNILNEERSSDRFLVAASAIQLRAYWYHNTPAGIDKKDIINIASHYPNLFTMGKIVTDYVLKNHIENNQQQPHH